MMSYELESMIDGLVWIAAGREFHSLPPIVCLGLSGSQSDDCGDFVLDSTQTPITELQRMVIRSLPIMADIPATECIDGTVGPYGGERMPSGM